MQARPIWTWIGFSLNLSHIILNKPQAVRRRETLLAAVSTESTIYSRTINNLPLKGPWHPSRVKKPLHLILSKGSLLKRLLSVNGRQLSFDSDSEIKYTERRYQSQSVGVYGGWGVGVFLRSSFWGDEADRYIICFNYKIRISLVCLGVRVKFGPERTLMWWDVKFLLMGIWYMSYLNSPALHLFLFR